MSVKFAQNPNSAFRIIDGEAVILVPERQTLHRLADVGLRVWELACEGKAEEQISKRIAEEYEVEADKAEREAKEFLELLVKNGIIIPQSE